MSFWQTIPYWVYWIVGIAIALGIYYFLDDEQKSGVRIFLKKRGVWIALILGWLFFRERWGFFEPSDFFGRKANTLFLLFALLWALAINFLDRERYISTHAECDNRSGSCARYDSVGDYIILNIGSIDADFLPWKWGHESWVIPKRHFNKINNRPNASSTQIVVKTNVQKCDLTELHPSCHDFIESTNGYNKDNIYYGEFSLDELKSGKKIKVKMKEGEVKLDPSKYEITLKDERRMLNESRTMLKGKTSAIKGFVSDASVIQKKASGKSAFSSSHRDDKQGGEEY